MSQTELIRELRSLTSAGMKDCKDALEEAGWDLQKAVDIIKVKGQNIADGRGGRVAADGVVLITTTSDGLTSVMVEVNCQTDFVAKSSDFMNFAGFTANKMLEAVQSGGTFSVQDVEEERKAVVAITKENIVVRRFWAEQSLQPSNVKVFAYVHSNAKIGVILSLMASDPAMVSAPEFNALGDDLAMQVAAMSPLGVSADRLPAEDVARQKTIFETQLQEMNKPQAAWPKILEGKTRKWHTEVCLLEQESVMVPKTTVKDVIKSVGAKLGGEITVVNFVRCQVGEGIEKKTDNLAEEVAKMM